MESSVTGSSDAATLQEPDGNSASPPAAKVVQEISAPSAESSPATVPCPRCGSKLTNPEGLGWCPSCGYCRSLEDDASKAALATPAASRRPSPLGMVEFCEMLGRLPFWLWALL